MTDVVTALAPFLDLDATALSAADVQPRARSAFAAFVAALELSAPRLRDARTLATNALREVSQVDPLREPSLASELSKNARAPRS